MHTHYFSSGECKPTNPLEALRVGSPFSLSEQENLLVQVQNKGQEKVYTRKKKWVVSFFLLDIHTV